MAVHDSAVRKSRMSAILRLTAAMAIAICSEPSFANQADQASVSAGTWPQAPMPAKDAPNILLIMTDDVGFAASSAFGGLIPTPAFDALVREGAPYNQFNTTAMCSPTRASLLTGRNPHNVGMGGITNLASSFEGYNSVIPKSAGTIAQILKERGYNTAMFGKSHLTPTWEMTTAGPYDRWPTGLGFEYFYGFLGADTSQFEPALVENTLPLNMRYPDGYTLDADLADHAISWINQHKAVAPHRPFFMYYATGSAHSPNHAPAAWLEKFRGKFDQGWDALREEIFVRQKAKGVIPANAVLTPRPSELPAWNSLGADQQKIASRYMEAYAASLAYADAQIGRVIGHLKASGEAQNTLIVFIQGDNGSSGEGGLNGAMFEQSSISLQREDPAWNLSEVDRIGTKHSYTVLPAPWAWALDTPFQWTKQIASHLGGVRNGLVISWPDHISDPGKIRSQYHHVSDIVPTLLAAARIEAPQVLNGVEQKPIDGVSMTYTFRQPEAPSARKTQVYELMQNMAIYHEGWIASTTPVRMPWNWAQAVRVAPDDRVWELYNLERDYSQSNNLAALEPAKLKTMKDLFWKAAAANAILPIHDYTEGTEGRPDPRAGRSEFLYSGRVRNIAESASPPTIGRSYAITVDLNASTNTTNGVLVAQGGRYGGFSLYLERGRPIFHYNAVGQHQFTIASDTPIGPGNHSLMVNFDADKDFDRTALKGGPGGMLTISVDGKQVAKGRISRTLMNWISDAEGLDIGVDNNSPVTDAYPVADNMFDGTIRQTKISIK